jgi:hypothetical protein
MAGTVVMIQRSCPRPDRDSDTDAAVEDNLESFAMPTLGVGVGIYTPWKYSICKPRQTTLTGVL